MERSLYVKFKDCTPNSVDPDHEPSHLDLCCLQKPIIIDYGSERVKCLNFVEIVIFCLILHEIVIVSWRPSAVYFKVIVYESSRSTINFKSVRHYFRISPPNHILWVLFQNDSH